MSKIFKNKKDEFEWEKEHCLTIGKLIEYLKTFPEEALVYRLENNTNTWQSVSRGSDIFAGVKDVRKDLRKHLNHWYKDSVNKNQKISREIRETFRYAMDKDGICLYL